MLVSRPFVWLSILFFSLCMVHILALAGALRIESILQRLGFAGLILGSHSGFFLMTPAMSLAMAWLDWRFLEAPSCAWSRKVAEGWGVGKRFSVL